MRILDLEDLNFEKYNLETKALGLRDWLEECLRCFPATDKEISNATNIRRIIVFRFRTKRLNSMSFKNMKALRDYIQDKMKDIIYKDGKINEDEFLLD